MATEDYSEFVPSVHFEQIPIKNLVSNQDYQRPLSRKHVDDAAKRKRRTVGQGISLKTGQGQSARSAGLII